MASTGQVELSFSERLSLVKAFSELRNQPPVGAIGLVEFRDLLANLFPEFGAVRNETIDEFLNGYANEMMGPIPPARDPGDNLQLRDPAR